MNKILEIKFGSHLYGTNTENSDLDFKGIYLPEAKDIVLGTYQKTISTCRKKREHERNTKDDVDMEIFSLDRFLQLLCDGQTVALDLLFGSKDCPNPASKVEFVTDEGRAIMHWIFANRREFLNKNVNAFVGYARMQAAKYGVKGFRVAALRSALEFFKSFPDHNSKLFEHKVAIDLFVGLVENEHVKIVDCKGPNGTMQPHIEVCNRKVPFHATIKYAKQVFQRLFDEYGHRALLAEKNEGIDWKALSHAVRVNEEAKELLATANITFPRPESELLLKIKKGQMDYKEVAVIIEDGLEQLKMAQANSILPEAPNRALAQDFVYTTYKKIINKA